MTKIRRNIDLISLMEWRREVISEVFGVTPTDELIAANEQYYRTHIPDGSHVAYIVSSEGTDIGCGAICFTDELPSPDNPSGKCAYLMNVYIRKKYRLEGHADALIRHLVEAAREQGCGKIYLESTDMAKNLYRSNGFKNMTNMMKYADTDF